MDIKIGERSLQHGDSPKRGKRAKEYYAWDHMKARCLNPNSKNYKHYGGRGIKVCDRWLKYENFLTDMGRAPSPKHSLDRYPNPNGDYEPGNCRWATDIEQQSNRTNNVTITHLSETKTISEWSRITGISKSTISYRLKNGIAPLVQH